MPPPPAGPTPSGQIKVLLNHRAQNTLTSSNQGGGVYDNGAHVNLCSSVGITLPERSSTEMFPFVCLQTTMEASMVVRTQ